MKKTVLILTTVLLLTTIASAQSSQDDASMSTSLSNSIKNAIPQGFSTVDIDQQAEESGATLEGTPSIDDQPGDIEKNQLFSFSIVGGDEVEPGDEATLRKNMRIQPDGTLCSLWEDWGLSPSDEAYIMTELHGPDGKITEDFQYYWCDGTYTTVSTIFDAPETAGTYEYFYRWDLGRSDFDTGGNDLSGHTIDSSSTSLTVTEGEPDQIEVYELVEDGADSYCIGTTYEEGEEPFDAYYSETECESDLPDIQPANADINGDSEADAGQTVSFDGYDSTGEGSLSYEWEVNGDSIGSGTSTSHTFDELGSQTVSLTVEDSEGQTDTTRHNIYIDYEGPEAQASATQDQIELGQTLNLDASQSSGGTYTIEEYTWRAEGETFTGQRPSHTFEEAGSHTVELEVVDRERNSDTDSIQIDVIDTHELSNIKMEAARHVVLDDTQTLRFLESEAVSEAGIRQVEWEIGETHYYTGKEIQHQFRTRGDQQIEMTVIDNEGQEATQNHVITVQEEEPGVIQTIVTWLSDLFT